MSSYAYVAVDLHGQEARGTLEVPDQSEALRRIKEMGLFPTKLLAAVPARRRIVPKFHNSDIRLPLIGRRVKPAALTTFTRQLATLIEAGMPLLRGLRTLAEQQENRVLKRILGELSLSIENGSSFSEALELHPKIFNRLYVNMVKAGEIAGALEVTLKRLAEFMEKARKIKGKVKAAMVYPCAVLSVAAGVLTLLMVYVVPRFRAVFEGLSGNAHLPAFTLFVFNLSEAFKTHFLTIFAVGVLCAAVVFFALRTTQGRWAFDHLKLVIPVLGPVFRKLAVSRFSRTLGTLSNSGVPILQALTIVKETAGNVAVGAVIFRLHDAVKQGDSLAPTLKASRVFPAIVAGMVDVGEQTGALPDMLMKIADNYDEEVDNAVSALMSLLEPIMILLLAVIVGSIVAAMFIPLCSIDPQLGGPGNGDG